MMYRWLSYGFFAAGVGFLGLAGYYYFAPAPASCLEVSETDQQISDCVAGQEKPVVFHFNNTSSKPIRILGLNTC
jgi:hypothetical protein